jgi:hypothetical protein
MEVGLEADTAKAKNILISRHQNSEQIHDIKITNITFENVAKFKYIRTAVIYQLIIHEEIKR